MIKKSLFTLLVVFGFIITGSYAFTAHANNSWGGYHWARTTSPLLLKLDDNVSPNWDSYLALASSDWNLSNVLYTSVVPGIVNPKTCKGVLGRVEVCNSKYGNNGWLGIASIWANGTHITQATVKLNDTYFDTTKYNTPAWKKLVTCQEIGHTFGLDHQDEVFANANLGTCMDYTNDPDGSLYGQLSNEHPNTHDYDELGIVYAHLDSVTTASQAPVSNRQEVDHADPSTWGKQVHSSANGKGSLYSKDLGNGDSVFTFVTWAE